MSRSAANSLSLSTPHLRKYFYNAAVTALTVQTARHSALGLPTLARQHCAAATLRLPRSDPQQFVGLDTSSGFDAVITAAYARAGLV